MKILQVIDQLEIGGAERVCLDQANLLASKEHQVTVLSILEKGPLSKNLDTKIHQVQLARGFKFSPKKMIQFSSICNEFDIVHIHQRYILRYAIVANLLKNIGSAIVFQDHFGSIDIDQSTDYLLKYSNLNYQYIGVSEKLCEWAKWKLHLPVSKIHLLPNIVFKQQVSDPNLNSTTMKLILVSNFREVKNIEFSLEIVKKLQKQSLDCILDIYGATVDLAYREKVNNKINELGLTTFVRIIEGVSNIQPHLNQYSIALHTSKSETGPLVLIEYLSQGLPFLAYSTGEVAARLQAEEWNDFFVHSFEINDWIKKIKFIIGQDRSVWKTKMDSCFEKLYSSENYYQQCMKIYQSTLHS